MYIGPQDPLDSKNNSNQPIKPSQNGKDWTHKFHASPDLERSNSNLKTSANYDLCDQNFYKGLDENSHRHTNLEEKCEFSLSTPQVADQVTAALIDSNENMTVPFVFVFEDFDMSNEYEKTVNEKEQSSEDILETETIEVEKNEVKAVNINQKSTLAARSNEKNHVLFEMGLEFINQTLESTNVECENPTALSNLLNHTLSVLGTNFTEKQVYTSLSNVLNEAQRSGILTKNGQPLTEEEFKDLIKEFESTFRIYYSNYKLTIVEEKKPENLQDDSTKDISSIATEKPIRAAEKKEKPDKARLEAIAEFLNTTFISHQEILRQINKVGEEKARKEKAEKSDEATHQDIKLTHKYKIILKEDIDRLIIQAVFNNQINVRVKTLIKITKISKKFSDFNQKGEVVSFYDFPKFPNIKPLTIRVAA